MNAPTPAIEHPSRRLIVDLPHSYDAARTLYETLVPEVDYGRFSQLATWQAHLDLADSNAPHGFMYYYRGDVTAIMATSTAGWKATQYLMGNHTIAERMFLHDPSVMLHAPLRTLLYADPAGRTHLAVDQPSLLFDSYHHPEISAVGAELDALLAQLIVQLGAHPPAPLNQAATGADRLR